MFGPFMETVFPWLNSLCEYLPGFQTEYVLFISCISFIFTDEPIINHVIYDLYVYMWLVYSKISQIGWRFIFIKTFSWLELLSTYSTVDIVYNVLLQSHNFFPCVNNRWHGVASWTWDAQDETCGICRMAFDGCCPDCKLPGDDCPLSK